MTQEEISNIYNKLSELGRGDLADQFYTNPDKFDFGQLESDPNFTDKYETIADFLEDHDTVKANLWKKYEGKFPSDTRFESLQSKYPWLNKEDLKEWFDKTNEYKKFYEDEARKEGEKNLRKKEVKDWGFFQNLLASDYSKQRYIDDPNASLFGKQGKFNPYTSQGQEELRDVIFGGTGAVADLLPGAGAVVGPFVRTARDISHKVTDSPYQKDYEQIGIDFGKDMSANLGAWLLSNARKGAKAVKTGTSSEVSNTLAAEQMMNNTKQAVNLTNPMNVWVNLSDGDLIKNIRNLPESPMKNELLEAIKTAGPGRHVNRQAITDISSKYTYLTSEGAIEPGRQFLKGDYTKHQPFANETFVKEQALATPYKDLTKKQQAQYWLNRGAELVNSGWPGQIMVQEGYTSVGRGKTPNVVETALQKAEKDATIDRLISSYSLLWNKNKEPAEAKNNPIIKAAWKKWSEQE